jgi:RHS repeat-associated protein
MIVQSVCGGSLRSCGELESVTTNGSTTTFGYDGWGRRVRKTTGGATTGFVWDGDDLALELDGAGALVRAYSYYPGVDQPHSVTHQGGAIHRYAPELPGHVAGLVGAGNTVANTYTYTPFGEPLTTNEQVPQPLRYMSREYDAETGLYYVRARYYDPQQGRFVSEDPIGLAGGINPYAYVSNDPVNATDPFGLAECTVGKQEEMRKVGASDAWIIALCGRVSLPGIVVSGGKIWEYIASGPSSPYAAQPMPTFEDFQAGGITPEHKAEETRAVQACLFQTGLAVLNVALDLSGTRILGAAAWTGVRAGIMASGKGAARIGAGTRSFATHAPAAFAPTAMSAASNVGGSVGMGYHSGSWGGKDIAKLAGSFVPVLGSVLAIGDAYSACASAFNW